LLPLNIVPERSTIGEGICDLCVGRCAWENTRLFLSLRQLFSQSKGYAATFSDSEAVHGCLSSLRPLCGAFTTVVDA